MIDLATAARRSSFTVSRRRRGLLSWLENSFRQFDRIEGHLSMAAKLAGPAEPERDDD